MTGVVLNVILNSFFSWISKKLILKELPYLAEVANCVFRVSIQTAYSLAHSFGFC